MKPGVRTMLDAAPRGVAVAMHFAGTPISFMANVRCAAATPLRKRCS